MKRWAYCWILALVALPAAALAGAGDSCGEAVAVTDGVAAGQLAPGGFSWAVYTAGASGNVAFNTDRPGTSFDTTLAAFESCGGPQVKYAETVGERKAAFALPAAPGGVYYLRVGGMGQAGGNWEMAIGPSGDGVCPAAAGDCFTAHGGLGCNDQCDALPCPDCCATICAIDGFCCSVAWDTICEAEAKTQCTVIPVELQSFDVGR